MTTDPNYSPWQLLPAPEPCTELLALRCFKSTLSSVMVLFYHNVTKE